MKCCYTKGVQVFPEIGQPEEDSSAKRMKEAGDKMARDIVISHFKSLLEDNPNTTLEMAILSFENAGPEYNDSLLAFSKSKTRTPEMYIASYSTFFSEAKEMAR